MAAGMSDLRRLLPAVESVLSAPEAEAYRARYGHRLLVDALRAALEDIRSQIQQGALFAAPTAAELLNAAEARIAAWLTPSLRPVINATGVILHTNLGRAPLSEAAVEAVQAVAGGYSTLEYDIEAGGRGERSGHAEALLTRLTGAEAAFVVNNNAAATMLALSAVAAGQGVIVARGQLVEIGGGYRMPDVMAASGARLIEVGTTNRTRISDYTAAVDESTSALLRVHHSNYRIVGFAAEPGIEEMAELARAKNLPLIDDLGSGALIDTAPFGLAPEPMVQASVAAGADLILFSGDKLLGGPQAGIILGRASLIAHLKAHPLARAVRADKLCLAALHATLLHYLKDEALLKVPVWRMISMPGRMISQRARRWRDALAASPGVTAHTITSESTIGGGSLPGEALPTTLLALKVPQPEALTAALRQQPLPIIARVHHNQVVFDPRTVSPHMDKQLLGGITAALELSQKEAK